MPLQVTSPIRLTPWVDSTAVEFSPELSARLRTSPVIVTPSFVLPEVGLWEVPVQGRLVPLDGEHRAAPVWERSTTPVPAVRQATPVRDRPARIETGSREPALSRRRAAAATTPRARNRGRTNADPAVAEVMRSNAAIARSLASVRVSWRPSRYWQTGHTFARSPSDGANLEPAEPLASALEPKAPQPGHSHYRDGACQTVFAERIVCLRGILKRRHDIRLSSLESGV